MKIGNKLIIGFMVIASLVGFVGIFSAISHNNIQTNNEIITEVLELDIILDDSVIKLLALVQVETVEDYIREKTDYEQIRAEFDLLLKQLNNEHAKKLPYLGFDVEVFYKDAGELAKVSNSLIAIHKRCLAKNKAFKEKESLEKKLRYKCRALLIALQDNALTRDMEKMEHESKEALYQYKDQEHGVGWLETISKVKNNPLTTASQDISKDLSAYERVAQDLCKIIVEQKTIETGEHLVFWELRELISRIEENQTGIVGKIKAQSRTLARNTYLIMFAVIVGAFLVSIILGLAIARSISKPVANLVQTTQSIAQGDFSVRVDVATADEIGELAASFNKMAEDLQRTTISIANLSQEITQRKKTEGLLQKSNEDLKDAIDKLDAANQELADFAHITAHDLKAPLRAIGGLAGMMLSDYNDKLDDQGKEMLRMLVGRTERMSDQISSILHYSEIGRTGEKKDRTDLNLSVKEAISNIDVPENVEITIENQLPTAICEKTRIVQVFQNLIDNAIKYIDKPHGWIKIGCVAEDGWWKFSVSDNGIGIEQEYFEKIFQIFRTLVRRDEKEATGIGLSIVKKIVEIHGGKVWIESKVGQGSTFFFTLAKQEVGIQNELSKQKMGVKNEEFQANIVS
ncbi:MAG: HAMP domain-containing protein [Phycisphaerae bacterium]|nr:HAMP domain-containing protein [Phycisphaerae bacterium]